MGNRPANNFELPSTQKLKDAKIVARCLKNERDAWDEFFRRFIPTIKKAIKNKLYTAGHTDLYRDPDVIWDIHQEIVIKLFQKGILRQCTDPSGVKYWLKEIASNQTIDWLRRDNRTKNLPEKQTRESILSLSAPLNDHMNLTLEDTLADNPQRNEDIYQELEEVLSGMDEMKNEQAFWVLRLSIIVHMPFTEEEIKRLAAFARSTQEYVKSQLDKITVQVEKKVGKKIKASARAVILWHEMRRLENELHSEWRSCGTSVKADNLINKIQKKAKQRGELLKQSQSHCRPSNPEIAALVGLSEDKVEQVSVILLRARQALQKIGVKIIF